LVASSNDGIRKPLAGSFSLQEAEAVVARECEDVSLARNVVIAVAMTRVAHGQSILEWNTLGARLRLDPSHPSFEITDFCQDCVAGGELLLNDAARFLLGLGPA